ncbi:hypothetical protein QFZ49_000735 [Streptomyces turgidiscabies]|uniref:Uncharacterized protein n=1 Tax=Streptomyces turgidiscabies TaxID=85558 RepID=A0ABU0RGF1_9ACTN|nr:hypothetical protein [Streptomyces turgidiscabies]
MCRKRPSACSASRTVRATRPVANGVRMRAPGRHWASQARGTDVSVQVAMIRSKGPRSGTPRAPSPVTTTGWCPAAARCRRGRLGDLRVQIHRRDEVVAEAVREQRRVVSRTGADLQDVVPVLDLQLGEHRGHEGGLAAGGDQLTVAHPGRQRHVRVGAAQPALTREPVRTLTPQPLPPGHGTGVVVRHEQMPWHHLERLPPDRVAVPGPAGLDHPHELGPRRGGEVAVPALVELVHAHTSTVLRPAPGRERRVVGLASSVSPSETMVR